MLPSKKQKRFAKLGAISVVVVFAVTFILGSRATETFQPVELGSASGFAVLAGKGITNTGATILSGTAGSDIGSSPTSTFTGSTLVTTDGTKYAAADPATAEAKLGLLAAYNDAASRTSTSTVTADLGGTTLMPGVYSSAASIGVTGTLTLDADGDSNAIFIFQAGSTLITAVGSEVALINGAQASNVFWQVGSSATFGVNSTFTGHVLALASITAATGASFEGQLLAMNGAVTMDTNNINNDLSVIAAEPEPIETEEPAPVETEEPAPVETEEPGTVETEEPGTVETEEPAPEETWEPAPVETEAPAPIETEQAANPDLATDTGGQLPDTGNPNWVIPLGIGFGIAALGAGVFLSRKRLV